MISINVTVTITIIIISIIVVIMIIIIIIIIIIINTKKWPNVPDQQAFPLGDATEATLKRL